MDLYRPGTPRNPSTGRVLAPTREYTLAALDVPCYFEIRSSVETPQMFGRMEGDQIFTIDTIHLGGEVEIDSGWIAVNRTFDSAGYPSQNYGRFWVVQGQPKSISNRGRRRARKRSVEAIQQGRKPEGLTLVP